MSGYIAPVDEMMFVLQDVIGADRLSTLPGGDATDAETIRAIFEEAAKFSGEVLAPLNRVGDRHGAKLENGVVRTAPGWKPAYDAFVAGGWNTLPFEPEFGGQGLPFAIATVTHEMWQSASLAFSLAPLLTQGAIEALQAHGTREQKAIYLPKMIAGTWTGTMNLTEPQAGSDVGALKTRARQDGDRYRITGQKIFITYGDHDLAENVIHLVLARLPDAPPGSRGISLFIVPKFLPDADGNPGERNDLRVVSLEHKLGIHASPTCVMAYGDGDGAIGFLLGEPNRGLECMFTMMNNARLAVGLQGVAIAERAYQLARNFARARIQSRELGTRAAEPVAILRHPDVRRMLATMRSMTEAARALAYDAALSLDLARRASDPAERERQQARVDLLTPVVKAWSTDLGVELASLGLQVHGGMGFIEETGAAQLYRDARILPIYEGTNGIQANDLVFRKLARDGGGAARAFLREIALCVTELQAITETRSIALILGGTHAALEDMTETMVKRAEKTPRAAASGASAYLRMFGLVAGGFEHARAALAATKRLARDPGDRFAASRLRSARFYVEAILPQAMAQPMQIIGGAESTLLFDDDDL
jgi:alkylation response protein AidB-like acyl-CoA dehydrogenase